MTWTQTFPAYPRPGDLARYSSDGEFMSCHKVLRVFLRPSGHIAVGLVDIATETVNSDYPWQDYHRLPYAEFCRPLCPKEETCLGSP